jgi:hypothetical protein
VPELVIRERPPSMLRNIDGRPPGVLAAGLTVANTEVEDVDGGPPRGCQRHVRQRPALKLKTSMAAPLGDAGGRSGTGHH